MTDDKLLNDDARFYKELRSVLADCSEFLSDVDGALADRCEAMLSQVVADEPDRAAALEEAHQAGWDAALGRVRQAGAHVAAGIAVRSLANKETEK